MARFTDENKWRDVWFRKLSPGLKLIFLYLCDNCDLAGFLEYDIDRIVFETGVKDISTIEGALKGLGRSILVKGEYLWIKNFIKHQKNYPLNKNNPAHRGIIRLISERKEFHEEVGALYGPLKGLLSPIGIGKGIGKGNSKKQYSKETIEDAEKLYLVYPRHENKKTAVESICKALDKISFDVLFEKVSIYAECMKNAEKQFIPHPSTWFNQERWDDDIKDWQVTSAEQKISGADAIKMAYEQTEEAI